MMKNLLHTFPAQFPKNHACLDGYFYLILLLSVINAWRAYIRVSEVTTNTKTQRCPFVWDPVI